MWNLDFFNLHFSQIRYHQWHSKFFSRIVHVTLSNLPTDWFLIDKQYSDIINSVSSRKIFSHARTRINRSFRTWKLYRQLRDPNAINNSTILHEFHVTQIVLTPWNFYGKFLTFRRRFRFGGFLKHFVIQSVIFEHGTWPKYE